LTLRQAGGKAGLAVGSAERMPLGQVLVRDVQDEI
jgi:hypothetical protein